MSFFDEERNDGLPDAEEIALQIAAEAMAKLFHALTKAGLAPQEAAALTAAYVSQNMPHQGQGPTDGS